MIEVYGRESCSGCERVKSKLRSLGLEFTSHDIDVVGKEYIKENFPGHNHLPIVVVDGKVYSGAGYVERKLDEYKTDFGKDLLIEDSEFINE